MGFEHEKTCRFEVTGISILTLRRAVYIKCLPYPHHSCGLSFQTDPPTQPLSSGRRDDHHRMFFWLSSVSKLLLIDAPGNSDLSGQPD